VVLLLALLVAGAAEPPAGCTEAKELYESLSLDRAVEVADRTLFTDPHASRCLEIKAVALLVLGQMDGARAALAELFSIAPDYPIEDPSLSPGLKETIAQVRETVRPLSAAASASWLIHDELRVDFILQGGLRGASKVRYEIETAPSLDRKRGEANLIGRTGSATIAVTAADVGHARVKGTVLTKSNETLASFDSNLAVPNRPQALVPERVVVEVDNGTPTWPLWVGLGLAVIGGGIAIAIVAQPHHAPTAGVGETELH
jgi:hypothetical protein